MKKIVLIMLLALTLASCHKEGEIQVVYHIQNKTNGKLSVNFSSWGEYSVSHNGNIVIPHDFHATESVDANGEITMAVWVQDDDYKALPPTIRPAWEYITEIECMRVKVPATYYKDPANWHIHRSASVFTGEKIIAELSLTPEILADLNK